MNNTMILNKGSFPSKIALIILLLLTYTACKKVHQQVSQPNSGRMLQVELNMPEPWKKIVIGPTNPMEYPNIPQRFSMFMTGESTGALKPSYHGNSC